MHIAIALLFVTQSPTPGADLDAQITALSTRITALESMVVPPIGTFNADAYIPPNGDLADAIFAIQNHPDCSATIGLQGERAGCRILLARGVYPTKTITLCRQVVLQGTTGSGWGASTIIETNGTTAIHVGGGALCESLGFPTSTGGNRPTGAWSAIEHVGMRDVGTSTSGVYSAGIHLEARASVSNTFIDGFTQGIRVSAGVGRVEATPPDGFYVGEATNANVFHIQDSTVQNCRHAGFYADGPDANSGLTVLLNSASNCRQADAYTNLGQCANVVESSFLGNTHIAIHSADGNAAIGGMQILEDQGGTNRSVFVGTYTEGAAQNGESTATRNTHIVGGSSQWNAATDAMLITDDFISGFCTWDTRSSADNMRICFGRLGGTGLFAASSDSLQTLRLKYNANGWVFDQNNLGALRTLQFRPDGSVFFENGLEAN